MSNRGENIYKRKDKRWEGRYVKSREPNGKVHLGYVYASSYAEAKAKLMQAKSSVLALSPCTFPPLAVYFNNWLKSCKKSVKPSTYAKYQVMLNNHLTPSLGCLLPNELTSAAIDNFSTFLLCEKGLSPKTVRDILSTLRTITKYIRRQTGEFPQDIEFLYPRERKKEMRVLTPEEQHILIAFLTQDMDRVKFGVLLALLTGIRIGELCALRWQNISSDSIKINQTMQRLSVTEGDNKGRKTVIQLGDAKSESSRREIPLTLYAASLCERFRSSDNSAFILTGSSQKFMEPRTLQYRFSRYTRQCNLKGVHFHALRHTFATRCIEVGFDVKSLSEILGHSSVKITLDRYVHSSPHLKRINMDKLSAIGL